MEGAGGGEATEGTVETEPVEADGSVEAEAPADVATVTAHWHTTSQNKKTGVLEDTLVFAKTLTGVRGTTLAKPHNATLLKSESHRVLAAKLEIIVPAPPGDKTG
jgi:hypothetical protein